MSEIETVVSIESNVRIDFTGISIWKALADLTGNLECIRDFEDDFEDESIQKIESVNWVQEGF